MTQLEAVKAYKVLLSLGQERIPVATAYKLFQQKRALQPVFDFQAEQERAIIERYHARQNENGKLVTENPDDMAAMGNDLTELNTMECKVKLDVLELVMPDELQISMNDLEALDPVVKFIARG